MKFALVLSLASAAYALDIGKLLANLKPALKHVRCVAPALLIGIESLDCTDGGPLTTICTNIDTVVKDNTDAFTKCNIPKSAVDSVAKTLEQLCAKGLGVGKRDVAPSPCDDCASECQDNGCEEDDDCDFCELSCDFLCTE